jgi:hypothetical protein
MTIKSDGQGIIKYSGSDLRHLQSFFDHCFKERTHCDDHVVKTVASFTDDCHYYLSVLKLLTICYGIKKDLKRGFVNRTILSPKELSYIDVIIRHFQ